MVYAYNLSCVGCRDKGIVVWVWPWAKVKNNYSKKDLGEWLKWQNTCLASERPWVQTPVPLNKQHTPLYAELKKPDTSMYAVRLHLHGAVLKVTGRDQCAYPWAGRYWSGRSRRTFWSNGSVLYLDRDLDYTSENMTDSQNILLRIVAVF
jgi:hypothetical protein